MDFGSNHFITPPDWSHYSSMPSVTHLALDFNYFTAEFPSFILECHNLTYLDISQNDWNGTIPESMSSNLAKLEYLNLTNSGLEGKNNLFSGPIPEEIGNLKELIKLDLSQNQFSNPIPSTLWNLTNIQVLNLCMGGCQRPKG
ncbi:hypothetical protein JHK85_007921 [Glycine max]|nr:hypothetical protein JHK85_007921 [Glycine max]